MGLAPTTWLRSAGDRALDLLFPPSCVSCRADLEEDGDSVNLCPPCRKQLQRVSWPTCGRCAARVPDIPGTVADCGHCRGDKLRFDRALTFGSYEGLLGELVVRMKFDRSERLARLFGSLLAAELGAEIADLKPDAMSFFGPIRRDHGQAAQP